MRLSFFGWVWGTSRLCNDWKGAIKDLVRSSNRKRIRIDSAVHRPRSSCGLLIEKFGIGLTQRVAYMWREGSIRIAFIVCPWGATCFLILCNLGLAVSFLDGWAYIPHERGSPLFVFVTHSFAVSYRPTLLYYIPYLTNAETLAFNSQTSPFASTNSHKSARHWPMLMILYFS